MLKITPQNYLAVSSLLLIIFFLIFTLDVALNIIPFDYLENILGISSDLLIIAWWLFFDSVFIIFLFYGIHLAFNKEFRKEYEDTKNLLWRGIILNLTSSVLLTLLLFTGLETFK